MSFEYAPAPESRAVVSIKPKYGHFIGGKFVAGSKHFPTVNPATEEVLSQIALAGKAEVDAAVKAARKAYTTTWSKMSGKERGKYLYRIARILQERAREFAVLETLDNGKPIRESRDTDIPLAAAHMTLIKEDSVNNSFDGFINWRIIKNDICCFATQLEGHTLFGRCNCASNNLSNLS